LRQTSIRAFIAGFLVATSAAQHEFLASVILAIVQGGAVGFRAIARNLPEPKSVSAKLSELYRLVQWLPTGREWTNAMTHFLLANARGGRVVLANDWSVIGGSDVLMTSLVTPSRAIPLLWTLMPRGADQAALETEHYLDLQRTLPDSIDYIILADRGFGHARVINSLHFCNFVLRSKANVGIRKPGEEKFTKLSKIGYQVGQVQDFGKVDYCASNPVTVRVVRVRRAGQKEPWILLTNLDAPAKTVIRLYAARFRIEQMFRDFKSGFHLRGHYYEGEGNLDRMLATAGCAYLLLELAGLHAKKRGWHVLYLTDSGSSELARWRVGRCLALDPRRGAFVGELHLFAQTPNLTLKTGHWDWTPRPHEQLDTWPELTGDEAPPKKRNRGTRTERPCDAALRQRIREQTAQAKRTQTALAATIGMKAGHLSSILRGTQPVAACWIPRFAAFFGLSTTEFLDGTGWVPARKGRRMK
jgi:hypothetical protein